MNIICRFFRREKSEPQIIFDAVLVSDYARPHPCPLPRGEGEFFAAFCSIRITRWRTYLLPCLGSRGFLDPEGAGAVVGLVEGVEGFAVFAPEEMRGEEDVPIAAAAEEAFE